MGRQRPLSGTFWGPATWKRRAEAEGLARELRVLSRTALCISPRSRRLQHVP